MTRIIPPAAGALPQYHVGGTGAPEPAVYSVDDDPVVTVVPAVTNVNRMYAIVLNGTGGNTVYISGADDVTDTTGFPLAAGESIAWPSQAACYAICASGENASVLVLDFIVE